jgi:GH24 family phage-related lysozyme (muramidase)
MLKVTIPLIILFATIIPMKTFKQYLTEGNQNSQQIKCDINGICKVVKAYESAGNEEKVLGVYKDSKGLPTIGHGHLITKESEKIFGETFPEEQKKDPGFARNVLSGKGRLTPEQADKLLERDVKVRLPIVKKLAPEFENYSPELQAELASETFRGMTGKSPKAMEYLRAGKYEDAAKEYLNAKEYRESVKQKSGIAPRMEKLASAIRTEGQRRAKTQAASAQTTQAPR